MPSRPITAKQDQVILELFGQCLQKNVRAGSITVWQYQEAAFAGSWFNSPISIAIFEDMMAWNRRPDTLFAPAVFGFIDSSETCLILEHQTHFSTVSTTIMDFFVQFLDFCLRASPETSESDIKDPKGGGRNGEKELQVMDNIRCVLGGSKGRDTRTAASRGKDL